METERRKEKGGKVGRGGGLVVKWGHGGKSSQAARGAVGKGVAGRGRKKMICAAQAACNRLKNERQDSMNSPRPTPHC